MKRGLILAVILITAATLRAQNSTDVTPLPSAPTPSVAAVSAAKQGADERYERVAADVQALQTANEELQNKITGLEEEIRKLREEQSHQNDHAVSADDVKQLAAKIEEVDKKRADDRQAVTEEVRNAIAGLEKHSGRAGPEGRRFARRHRQELSIIPSRRPMSRTGLSIPCSRATAWAPS
jgi:chromosome segregation ATPase